MEQRGWCRQRVRGRPHRYGHAPDAINCLENPCVKLSALDYPVICFKIFWGTERVYDGMVLQCALNGGTSSSNVGAMADLIDRPDQNCYKARSINNLDGDAPQHGWSGRMALMR